MNVVRISIIYSCSARNEHKSLNHTMVKCSCLGTCNLQKIMPHLQSSSTEWLQDCMKDASACHLDTTDLHSESFFLKLFT